MIPLRQTLNADFRNSRSKKQPSYHPLAPSEHAALLHPPGSGGQVIVCRKAPQWREKAWGPSELGAILDRLAGETDCYLTMNRFVGGRRKQRQEHIHELGSVYVDFDFYGVEELRGQAPEDVLERVLEVVEGAGIPEPSLALSSGQGMYVAWAHDPLGWDGFRRWKACQDRLLGLLKPLGADPKARDAARVLRVAGTRNGKNGGLVYAIRPPGPRHNFKDLAGRMLPARNETEAELYDFAIQSFRRRPHKAPGLWDEKSMWEGRLNDVLKLLRLRFGAGRVSDYRDRALFVYSVGLSWISGRSEAKVFERELVTLGRELVGWDEDETGSLMGPVVERVEMLAAGQTVTFEGSEWDPRYHFKTETILEWLEITPDEQRQMAVLFGEEEGRRRDLEYRTRRRRAEGVRPRSEYDRFRAEALRQRTEEVRRLRDLGFSVEKIVAELGGSKSTVYRMLKGLKN